MQKYGANRPEDVYDKVLWSDLRTMFEPPLSEDAIWSLPLQQKMLNWRYYDSCGVHCLTLEATVIYMLAEREYPLSSDACQAMLDMKLQGGKHNEECYQLLKLIEKQRRMQLIASILSAMQKFWALVFFIPKTVSKEIEKLFKSFLWSQGEKLQERTSIAWKNVKWVNMYRLNGRSLWEVPIDDKASWGWRKLLDLREMVRPHIWSCLGDGENIMTWHDKWNDIGPLSRIISKRQIYSARFSNSASVADMMINNKKRNWDEVWKAIEDTTRMKLASLKLAMSADDKAVFEQWKIVKENSGNA
ncbi:hypothetical protein Tco_0145934 [Tanacetum coccineum]